MPSDRGLGRGERIKKEFEYRQVVTRGRLIPGRAFKAYFLIHKGPDRRAGFVAGKRVGNACRRNRSKRLLREAYRNLKPGLQPGGFSVVFVAKPAVAQAGLAAIRDEMRWMFEQCGLLEGA